MKHAATLFSCLMMAAPAWPAGFIPSNTRPPPPPREFRGAWVATVKNIDWPSKPGLSTAQQKAELLAILDRAAQLKLNAVLLQVRPACDALYASTFEPWSEYLTGKMGQAPKPFYDPLEFAVTEAHRRGLELHAWFNPFRARHNTGFSTLSKDHISKTHPEFVRTYGKQLWLDPGDRAAREYSLAVILDLVKRYDIDGAHMDDYFYPYAEKDKTGATIDFPDWPSWKRYLDSGGKLSRGDWRRENVNGFVHRLNDEIKARKPWVKFGVSPFGIWRPGQPAEVRGLDAYAELYADSRLWLVNGWMDYCAPQLYWAIEPKEQSYPALLKWWTEQNPKGRHLWPGNNTFKAGGAWPNAEIANQIRLTRQRPGAGGNIHWSMSALMKKGGIADELAQGLYANRVLVPASPWLDKSTPGQPSLTATNSGTTMSLRWTSTGEKPVAHWVMQFKLNDTWWTEIFPGGVHSASQTGKGNFHAVAVTAIDRCGNASEPAVLEREPEGKK